LVLRGVTVVETADGARTPNLDIQIADGVITAISATAPDGLAEVVDATGKYVVPGYVDMHVHALPDHGPIPAGALGLMLANGITGFRQMSGSLDLLARRRAGTLGMPVDAPGLLAMPGGLLTPMNAGTAAAAVATVREHHLAGADFVKAALVTPAVYFEAQTEANRLGIPLLGHLPSGIDVRAAARSGFRSIEHLGPGATMLVGCSCEAHCLADELAAAPGVGLPAVRIPFLGGIVERVMRRVLRRIVVNPTNMAKPADIALMQRAIDTFDEDVAAALAADVSSSGTWQCPTLIRMRAQQLCDAAEFSSDPHLRFMAPSTVAQWTAAAEKFGRFTDAQRATFRAGYDLLLRLTKIYDRAGARMLAGTDAVGAAWVVPGFSLHREFAELAAAGLSPLRILQMTTSEPAAFLGTTDTMGSVEVGMQADLVVLDADPVVDVANLARITAVVRAGNVYSSADLDRLKNRIAAGTPAL
jgi:imidazolonepropionase-like amidohydrolase